MHDPYLIFFINVSFNFVVVLCVDVQKEAERAETLSNCNNSPTQWYKILTMMCSLCFFILPKGGHVISVNVGFNDCTFYLPISQIVSFYLICSVVEWILPWTFFVRMKMLKDYILWTNEPKFWISESIGHNRFLIVEANGGLNQQRSSVGDCFLWLVVHKSLFSFIINQNL